jgi:GNAT superfamily N-acetyltransferase
MIENSQIRIRPMNLDDIGNCILLSGAESWNQSENDWKRLVDSPLNMCLVAEYEKGIVGTATAINYANELAWISMVLVNKAFRGRGISKMLLSKLLDRLKSCRSVKLDATPAGQPVYEKLGFRAEYIIYQMNHPELPGQWDKEGSVLPEVIQEQEIEEVISLDRDIFGAKRSGLITSLVNECPDKAWLLRKNGTISGFALVRKGKFYTQVGPVFAAGQEDAKNLISNALGALGNLPVMVDVPADKKELIEWLGSTGFEIKRHFVRMYLKENPYPGKRENQFLICGPEFG